MNQINKLKGKRKITQISLNETISYKKENGTIKLYNEEFINSYLLKQINKIINKFIKLFQNFLENSEAEEGADGVLTKIEYYNDDFLSKYGLFLNDQLKKYYLKNIRLFYAELKKYKDINYKKVRSSKTR